MKYILICLIAFFSMKLLIAQKVDTGNNIFKRHLSKGQNYVAFTRTSDDCLSHILNKDNNKGANKVMYKKIDGSYIGLLSGFFRSGKEDLGSDLGLSKNLFVFNEKQKVMLIFINDIVDNKILGDSLELQDLYMPNKTIHIYVNLQPSPRMPSENSQVVLLLTNS